EGNVAEALARLATRGYRTTRSSSLYLTEPVGGPPQDWFVNAVVDGETALAPEALLEACLPVEQGLRRVRREPNGPPTIDVDILVLGGLGWAGPAPGIPHPRLHERRFVLEPLAEILPERVHPVLGRTVRELLASCPDASAVRRLAGARA